MEIYVETMPSDCDECPCCNSDVDYGACCNLGAYGYVDYYPTTRKHPNCPLKSLKDALAEERKKVVQELKDWCDKNFNWVGDGTGYDGQDYNEMIGSNNTINKLREILDQIERGE